MSLQRQTAFNTQRTFQKGNHIPTRLNKSYFEDKYNFKDIKYVFAVDQTGRMWKGRFYVSKTKE